MNYKNLTVAALDLIGLELFRENVPENQRDKLIGTLSYRAFHEAFPFTEIDDTDRPEVFLANGDRLYHNRQLPGGGYQCIQKDGKLVNYYPLYMYMTEDMEKNPANMIVGYTTLPGYDKYLDKNSINLLYVQEERVQAILNAHPEVKTHPDPVKKKPDPAIPCRRHRSLFL